MAQTVKRKMIAGRKVSHHRKDGAVTKISNLRGQ